MSLLFYINQILILVTVGISMYAFSNDTFKQKWMHKPYRVKENNEWWRLITSGFVHADWMHLFFNMLSLYFFGHHVVNFFLELGSILGSYLIGVVCYLLFYISAIVVSSLSDQKKYAGSRSYASLGASGAVSAAIFASILLKPLNGIHILPFTLIWSDGIPGFLFAPLYLWYCHYMSKQQLDNINHDAHYFGAIYGLLVIAVIHPSSITTCIDEIIKWSSHAFF